MSTVDRVLSVFATPDCPDCQGKGVVMGRVWQNGKAWIKDNDRICNCVPRITVSQRN